MPTTFLQVTEQNNGLPAGPRIPQNLIIRVFGELNSETAN